MKKHKIFLLLPMTGLLLTGCTLQDGWNWVNSNIFSPIGAFFSNLFGPHSAPKQKEKSDDQKVYEDSFDAKKLLLKRNLKWTASNEYEDEGVKGTSINELEFDVGKVKYIHTQGDAVTTLFASHTYDESTDKFGIDWYTPNYSEEELIGYEKHYFDDLSANEVVFAYYGLIIDVPFIDLVQKDGHYEAENISREYYGEVITIPTYKVYIGKTFVSKVYFEGTIVDGEKEYPISAVYTFSNFNEVHVELPTPIN